MNDSNSIHKSSLFRSLRSYLFLIILLCGTGLIFLGYHGKSTSYLILNQWLKPELNDIIPWTNWIGDGKFAIFIGIAFLIFRKSRELGISLIASYLISGLLAQLLKRMILMPRPEAFFNKIAYSDIIMNQGNINLFHSFPSGHTTTAFAMATVLSYYYRSTTLQIVFFLLAIIAGFSRIFLGQHFLTDVLAGIVLGTGISLWTMLFIRKWHFVKYKKMIG
jgi:membrane-associated phospholipid phosphatase